MADYYTTKSGSDSNPGTLLQPKLTISAGLALLSSGDTLNIGAGTYTEGISYNQYPDGISPTIRTTIKGMPGATVIVNGTEVLVGAVVTCYNHVYIDFDNLVIDGTSATFAPFFITGDGGGGWSHYIRIQNSTVRNHDFGGGSGSALITFGGAAGNNANMHFKNLTVHNSQNGVPVSHGIYLTAPDSIIEDCLIYDCEGHGIQIYGNGSDVIDNAIVRRCKIHDCGQSGVLMGSGTDQAIYNCIIWNCAENLLGDGGLSVGAGSTVGCVVVHNTVYNNDDAKGGIWLRNDEAIDTIVKNNLITDNASGAIFDEGTTSDISNNVSVNPDYVNAAGADFHLTSTSDAIGAGTVLGAPYDYDYDNVSRGASPDCGAFQFVSTVVVFPTHTTLHGGIAVMAGGFTN